MTLLGLSLTLQTFIHVHCTLLKSHHSTEGFNSFRKIFETNHYSNNCLVLPELIVNSSKTLDLVVRRRFAEQTMSFSLVSLCLFSVNFFFQEGKGGG